MTFEALVEPEEPLPMGEARFIRPSEAKALVLRSEQDGYVRVDVPELRPALRGRLAWLLEEAVERSLELRGACSPGFGASANLELSLTDQLYRARLIGGRGFVIAIPTLEGLTNRRGALDADDSEALRWWIGGARQHAIRLYLDVADCMLGAYLDPITLTQLMQSAPPPMTTVGSPPVVVEWVDTGKRRDAEPREETEHFDSRPISDVVATTRGARATTFGTAPDAHHTESADDFDRDRLGATEAVSSASPSVDGAAPAALRASDRPSEPAKGERAASEPADGERVASEPACGERVASEPACGEHAIRDVAVRSVFPGDCDPPLPTETTLEPVTFEPSIAPPPATAPEEIDPGLTPVLAPTSDDLLRVSSPCNEIPILEASDPVVELHVATHDEILPIPHPPTIPAPEPVSAIDNPAPLPQKERPLHVDAPNAWRSWMQRLEAARGPKPLNAIEQLFINAYVPLQDALLRGIAEPECRPVLDRWSVSFAKSYTEAFDAMRLRGRRPMMVLDIPEAAQRLARLHGARTVQLVLVDGMRFDLGLRVESRLTELLGQQATLTDRFLLWSALPTNTSQQLELIARGPDGLRDGDVHSETPALVARGRAASTLRRVRAGSRELLKLDLVEARLGEPGGPPAERLDELSIELADTLAAALQRMPPRTLVAIFGDHGFCLDISDARKSSLRQGGASPDEVLVPGSAWLVGQTH